MNGYLNRIRAKNNKSKQKSCITMEPLIGEYSLQEQVNEGSFSGTGNRYLLFQMIFPLSGYIQIETMTKSAKEP